MRQRLSKIAFTSSNARALSTGADQSRFGIGATAAKFVFLFFGTNYKQKIPWRLGGCIAPVATKIKRYSARSRTRLATREDVRAHGLMTFVPFGGENLNSSGAGFLLTTGFEKSNRL